MRAEDKMDQVASEYAAGMENYIADETKHKAFILIPRAYPVCILVRNVTDFKIVAFI